MPVASVLAAFRGLPRSVWWLALASAINRSGSMVLPFLVLFLTQSRGMASDDAGRLISLYGVAGLLGSYVGGLLSDRFSTKKVQIASLVSTAAIQLVLGRQTDPFLLAICVFTFGITNEALRPANLAAFTAAAGESTKTRALALARLSVNFGETCGWLLGGELAEINFYAIFVIDAATCLLAAWVIAATQRPIVTSTPASRPPLLSFAPLRDRPFAVALLLTVVLASILFQFLSTYPLFLASHYQFPKYVIGRIVAINTVLIVLCEMVLVKRLEHKAPLPLVALGSLLLCLGLGILPLFDDISGAIFSMVVITLGEMFWAPFLSAFVASRGSDSMRGRYMGLYVVAFAGGQTLGPWLGTALYERVAPSAPFYASLGLGPVLAIAFLALGASASRASRVDELST
jgi:predicted MFS family arabinose efflux permease